MATYKPSLLVPWAQFQACASTLSPFRLQGRPWAGVQASTCASAGNRAPVTAMGMLYSATRPLMQLQCAAIFLPPHRSRKKEEGTDKTPTTTRFRALRPLFFAFCRWPFALRFSTFVFAICHFDLNHLFFLPFCSLGFWPLCLCAPFSCSIFAFLPLCLFAPFHFVLWPLSPCPWPHASHSFHSHFLAPFMSTLLVRHSFRAKAWAPQSARHSLRATARLFGLVV